MLWQLENDDSISFKKEYVDELVNIFSGDRGLALIKLDPDAVEFKMGHKTARRIDLVDLPPGLHGLVESAVETFSAKAPYVFLVICGPGYPISRHFHKDISGVSAFQPLVVLNDGPVSGVTFGNNTLTLTTNRALINVREWHSVEPQETTTIWVSLIAAEF